MYMDRFPDGHSPRIEGLNLLVYDVGVDANGYKPISIDQIAEYLKLGIVKARKENG